MTTVGYTEYSGLSSHLIICAYRRQLTFPFCSKSAYFHRNFNRKSSPQDQLNHITEPLWKERRPGSFKSDTSNQPIWTRLNPIVTKIINRLLLILIRHKWLLYVYKVPVFFFLFHHAVKNTCWVYFVDSAEGLPVFKKASQQLITDSAKTRSFNYLIVCRIATSHRYRSWQRLIFCLTRFSLSSSE